MKLNNRKLNEQFELAIKRFNNIVIRSFDERNLAIEDRKFYGIAGHQWNGLEEQFENKPMFEFNKVHMGVLRIINEYRNNRITVDFVPKDGRPDLLADVCDALFRADEQDSSASEAYDNSYEEAASGGFGAFRLVTVFENPYDEDSDTQRIRIEPIFDADKTVYFDPNAYKQDKSDAKYVFVMNPMGIDDFYAEYGEYEPATAWTTPVGTQFQWKMDDTVYVAEYYYKEIVKTKVHFYTNALGGTKKIKDSDIPLDELANEAFYTDLHSQGWEYKNEKSVNEVKIRKLILTGSGVLEDCGYIAGNNLPIIPVFGKRLIVDGVEHFMGHVRFARGAQQLKNMMLSKLAELSSMPNISKPIFTPEQIKGHQYMWEEDSVQNYSYLLLNSVRDEQSNALVMPGQSIGYTKPPELPPVLAALMQVADADIKDILGNQEAGEKIVSNVSGKGIELIQNRLDMQSYIFIDNFKKAIKRCGEVWLGMAKDVYVEAGRKMRGVLMDGQVTQVELQTAQANEDGSIDQTANDMTKADFDVAVDTGATTATRRQQIVKVLIEMLQYGQNDPETSQILLSLILMNLEGEGLADVRKFYRTKLIGMGVVKATKEEQQALAGKEPTPDQQYLQASALKAKAQADQARSTTELNVAKVEEIRTKSAIEMAKLGLAEQQQILQTLTQLEGIRTSATSQDSAIMQAIDADAGGNAAQTADKMQQDTPNLP